MRLRTRRPGRGDRNAGRGVPTKISTSTKNKKRQESNLGNAIVLPNRGFPSQSMDDLGKRAAFARLAWRLGGWTPEVDRERSGGQGLPCPGRAGVPQAPLVLGAIGGGGRRP